MSSASTLLRRLITEVVAFTPIPVNQKIDTDLEREIRAELSRYGDRVTLKMQADAFSCHAIVTATHISRDERQEIYEMLDEFGHAYYDDEMIDGELVTTFIVVL